MEDYEWSNKLSVPSWSQSKNTPHDVCAQRASPASARGQRTFINAASRPGPFIVSSDPRVTTQHQLRHEQRHVLRDPDQPVPDVHHLGHGPALTTQPA